MAPLPIRCVKISPAWEGVILQAVYRRFCQEEVLLRAARANRAFYAKRAKALSSKVFHQVVDLASGDVVQLVRTLPSNRIPFFSYL